MRFFSWGGGGGGWLWWEWEKEAGEPNAMSIWRVWFRCILTSLVRSPQKLEVKLSLAHATVCGWTFWLQHYVVNLLFLKKNVRCCSQVVLLALSSKPGHLKLGYIPAAFMAMSIKLLIFFLLSSTFCLKLFTLPFQKSQFGLGGGVAF